MSNVSFSSCRKGDEGLYSFLMNRKSFFKHAVCILFLIFAMGQVWGRDYTSENNGNWSVPVGSGTWNSNPLAIGQYPKAEGDNVTIYHEVTVPSGCEDAKAGTVNVGARGVLSISGKLTATTINVESGGTLVTSTGITASAINVKSGGKIVLNSWPTPAPTFNDGCIVEIGPSFPDSGLMGLNSALQAVKTAGGTIAELIVSRSPYTISSNLDFNTITVKAGGKLIIDNGVSVTAKTLTIEGDGTSENSSDYGEVVVYGNFKLDVQEGGAFVGKTTNSGKLTVESSGFFDSNYTVNNEKGVIIANGFFRSGNFHNKGSFTVKDTVGHGGDANCCKVINEGDFVFGDGARFLIFYLSNVDFDGTFTNKKNVSLGNSVYLEISVKFENAANGSVEIGSNTNLVFSKGNVSFINAGNLTVKNGAKIIEINPAISATFTNSGYLIREESTIFNYTSDANTLWIENRFNEPKDFELSTNANLVLNVAGNMNLLVGDDTSIKSLNLLSRKHGVSTGDGQEHTITSDFKVTVRKKESSTGTLNLETISVSRTSRTDGVKGTLDLHCEVNCSNAIAISSGTELDINAEVTAAGLTQNILSSNTTIRIGQGETFTTSGDVKFPADLESAGDNNHSLFSSKGTVVVQGGKTFQIDTTSGGYGDGNITFENGGTLTANSLTSSGTLTVNTTAADQTFTLNSNVTFNDVVLEGSNEKKLSVSGQGDFTLTGGENSYADYVSFQSSDHPTIKKDGIGAGIIAANSSAPGTPQQIFPEGWLDGSHYFIWKGATDSSWTTATNWLRNNSPVGKSDIEKITIDTDTMGNNPVISGNVTTKELEFKNSKSAKLSNGSLLTVEKLSGTGTLNLGSGTLINGLSTVLEIPNTIGLKFGDNTTETGALQGKITIKKVENSSGNLNIGTNSTVDFDTTSAIEIGSVELLSLDSSVTFKKDVTLSGSFTNGGTVTANGAVTTNGDFTNVGTVNGTGAFTFKGAFTDNGTWNGTGNFTFGAGTEKSITGNASTVYPFTTVSGNAKFVEDFTIGSNLLINGGTVSVDFGKTLTVNKDVSNNSGTLSGDGTIKIKKDFKDAGTTSISNIIFFGDNDHTFSNVEGTQYKTIKLDSSIVDSRNFTFSNNVKITSFSDESAKSNVTFNGTATLKSLSVNNAGTYTFNNDAKVESDVDFCSNVIFTKDEASLTGKNITFSSNVWANSLSVTADNLILNTKPEIPAAGGTPAVPAITFNASKLTLTGTAITISHKKTDGTCKLNGELFTDTSVTVNDNFHVTENVKITGGGKTFAVANEKKLFCGKDFRAQGTADSKLTISGDIAITSNENWSSCFAEAVYCTVKNSTVYCWDGSDYSSAEDSGLKAQISCEACIDGNNTKNWIFADITIESARTIDDHHIELVLNDNINNVAFAETSDEGTTYKALACLKGEGNNPDGTLRNGKWKNNSYVPAVPDLPIFYSIKSVAPGTDANEGKTIVIISLPENATWNTDATGTSAGNSSSTDSEGVHQTNIPDIIIDRGNGGTSEQYTVTNKWGKRFDASAFNSTTDGASPVLIAVYTGQENHTPGSTDGWDGHNFIEFVYSEEVQGVSSGNAPYTSGTFASDPAITIDSVASFEKGALVTKNFSDNQENKDLNQFYDIKTHSFKWGVATKNMGSVWEGFIDHITQFSGSVSIPDSCTIKDVSAAQNISVSKEGLTVSNVKYGDPTVSNWDTVGPDFVPIRKSGEWNTPVNSQTNYEIVGTSSSGNAFLEKLEFHMFDNAQSFNESDTVNWATRNGWINPSTYDLISSDPLNGTFAADIFGGARPFEGTDAGRPGSEVSHRTSGGIRKHSLVSAYTNGAFEYQTIDAENNLSAIHPFDNLSADISFGFTAIVFANPDTSITRQVSEEDSLYFGLKLPNSTTELRTTYIISYNPSRGMITDLAGNRFGGALDENGIKAVKSIDMTPPKMVMTVAPIGTKRLYVLFAKELQIGKLNLTNSSGQIPTAPTALTDIPKSLGLISLSTDDTPVDKYATKSSGEIDIDSSVPAKLLFKNSNYTGIELTLTKEATLENISNLYLIVKNESSVENAMDPITGIIGNISYIQDDIGNFLPVNSAHAFSDFAVNAVMPLYAYSTSDELNGEMVTNNLYGDGQHSVRDFSRDQQNLGTMIPGDDYTFIVKTCDEIIKTDQLVMITSGSPDAGSVSQVYNETTKSDLRVWLPEIFSAISSVANTNVIKSEVSSKVSSGFSFEFSKEGANPVDWGSGDEITFLYEIKKDSSGNDLKICHSPVTSVTGKVNVDVKSPLYALQLDNPQDLLSIDLWSFKLKTPVSQRGGVSILNNVINSVYGEKTLVKLEVPKAGANVTVAVMTLDGNIVKYLVSGFVPGGTCYYDWDGTNLNGGQVARGMYFIRVFGDGFDETRKVMVVK